MNKTIKDFTDLLVDKTSLAITINEYGADRPNSYVLWMGKEPLNLVIGIEEMDSILFNVSMGDLTKIDILSDSIYQIYKARREHGDDWDSMSDVIFQLTGVTHHRDGLEKIFVFVIPKDLRDSSYTWGMTDTPWRDNLHEWWEKNQMNKEPKTH